MPRRLAITLRSRDDAQDAGDRGDRPAAAGGGGGPRRDRLFPAGAGHPDLDPREPRAIPVHAHRRPIADEVGHWADALAQQMQTSPMLQRRRLRGAGSRPAAAGAGRPRNRRPARRFHADRHRHAERRLRPAADLDHLWAGQPVPRDPGGDAAISERSELALEALRSRLGRAGGGAIDLADLDVATVIPGVSGSPHGAAERLRALRAQHRAAGDRAPGAVSGGHHQLQSRARCRAQRRGASDLARPSARSACRPR